MPQKKVIIVGPAHPLRGGLASFNQRLAREFINSGWNCMIYSFSLQYPEFLFPGTTQYSDEPAPVDLEIVTAINSVNPLNWIKIGRKLRNEAADIIVVRYWLPLMGPALGTVLRIARKNRKSKIIAITDNVLPHEKRPGDIPFTRYFLSTCDAFVTMSEKVMKDLRSFQRSKPARQVLHPLYDNFGEPISKEEARRNIALDAKHTYLLFFGFIRKYKGLDILLRAMQILKERYQGRKSEVPTLLVAGEFYEDSEQYKNLVKELDISDVLVLRTEFIPDSQVRNYLCAADVVIQPYRNATQSGVTPLSYHFEKPMIVTNVGSLPDLVPHLKVGIVSEPQPAALAEAIEQYLQLGENYFIPHLRDEKKKYQWSKLVEAIIELSDSVQ